MTQFGGLDIGGTKIEASLFDEAFRVLETKRFKVEPSQKLSDMTIHALEWLFSVSTSPAIPVGIGVPGIVERDPPRVKIANITNADDDFMAKISAHFGREFFFENDCKAFTFSEAFRGAGSDYKRVFGLIMGTGMAAGLYEGGALARGHNNIAIEIGHIAMPSSPLHQHELPIFKCGCGRNGCIETYVSGTGMSNIHNAKFGQKIPAAEVIDLKQKGDKNAIETYQIWCNLMAHTLDVVMLMLDPDVIVLGGGLSRIAGVADDLRSSLELYKFEILKTPSIRIAAHGDSSGTRGAAIMSARERGLI